MRAKLKKILKLKRITHLDFVEIYITPKTGQSYGNFMYMLGGFGNMDTKTAEIVQEYINDNS